MQTPNDVLDFWFKECSPEQWFSHNAAFDDVVRQRFTALLMQASSGELYSWRRDATGRLAEIIVLDQFSRNIHRDQPQAFAQDGMALVLAQEMVVQNLDRTLNLAQRSFAYMPYMHSESRTIHQLAEQLFSTPGLERNHSFELKHKAIIERFGRYPHRNRILGRISTEQELHFLQQSDSSF